MITSQTAEETIRKAEECFSLGLISQETLSRVVDHATTDPDYSPIIDLPFDWEVEHERSLRRKAVHRSWRGRLLAGIRR